MWYNRFNKYLLKEGYKTIYPYVFIKGFGQKFVIITVNVDDINIIRTSEVLQKIANYLKEEFEMKNLEKIKFYRSLQIESLKVEFLSINGLL